MDEVADALSMHPLLQKIIPERKCVFEIDESLMKNK
jgi:hypothetical protein